MANVVNPGHLGIGPFGPWAMLRLGARDHPQSDISLSMSFSLTWSFDLFGWRLNYDQTKVTMTSGISTVVGILCHSLRLERLNVLYDHCDKLIPHNS